MSTRWSRTNLVLALVLAVLLALYLWPPATPGDGDLLTALAPEAIASVRVERSRRLVLALRRDGDAWAVHHPRPGPANPRRVAQLLAVARAPVAFRYPLAGAASRYGLDPPKAVLQLDDQRLAFGDRDPTQAGRYVQVGDQVGVVDDLFFNLLTLPPSHFAAD
ncbi:MAG: hypothetical protein QNJ91_16325 [Gammaproteobacteria bacterium]|nr:hypothetical protein [Gammaproteobacteria bacterium]